MGKSIKGNLIFNDTKRIDQEVSQRRINMTIATTFSHQRLFLKLRTIMRSKKNKSDDEGVEVDNSNDGEWWAGEIERRFGEIDKVLHSKKHTDLLVSRMGHSQKKSSERIDVASSNNNNLTNLQQKILAKSGELITLTICHKTSGTQIDKPISIHFRNRKFNKIIKVDSRLIYSRMIANSMEENKSNANDAMSTANHITTMKFSASYVNSSTIFGYEDHIII
ncbi:hypothetical protein LIER_33786 [Lithospermum erythrorhizon]|uniref:Uncharacterized protein n=1 Tax=Lithospermum erythrorhizon TaxID=34254 RepID=A0AAV3RXU6_LITER